MSKGKYVKKGTPGKSFRKSIVLVLALVLVLGCAISGTVAWLMDTTDEVVNTFTVGNIEIDLKEHALKADGTLDQNTEVTSQNAYKIIPGTKEPKDPFVRVEANSEACWVFIEVKEENSAADYIGYDIDTTVWTALGNTYPGVYYKQLAATTADETLNILKDKEVTYSSELTKEEINELYEFTLDSNNNVVSMTPKTALPKLTFKAYAIQQTSGVGTIFTPTQAWAELNAAA